MSFTDERTAWDAYFKDIRELKKQAVDVGIVDTAETYPDGVTVQEVAAIQEFGYPEKHIPARPWLATTSNDPETQTGLTSEIINVVNGLPFGKKKPQDVIAKAGSYYVGRMRHIIETFPWIPNSPRTVREKGSEQPLIHTRLFISSIKAEKVSEP